MERNYMVLGSQLGSYGSLVGTGMKIEATVSNLQGREWAGMSMGKALQTQTGWMAGGSGAVGSN